MLHLFYIWLFFLTNDFDSFDKFEHFIALAELSQQLNNKKQGPIKMWPFVILFPAKIAFILGNQLTIGFIGGDSTEIKNFNQIDFQRVLLAAYTALRINSNVFDQDSPR